MGVSHKDQISSKPWLLVHRWLVTVTLLYMAVNTTADINASLNIRKILLFCMISTKIISESLYEYDS